MEELARVLRPNGRLQITDGVALPPDDAAALDTELRAAGLSAEPLYGFDLDELTRMRASASPSSPSARLPPESIPQQRPETAYLWSLCPVNGLGAVGVGRPGRSPGLSGASVGADVENSAEVWRCLRSCRGLGRGGDGVRGGRCPSVRTEAQRRPLTPLSTAARSTMKTTPDSIARRSWVGFLPMGCGSGRPSPGPQVRVGQPVIGCQGIPTSAPIPG